MPFKTVILADGYGTRLSVETSVRPKPMVEIGERPILWHIVKGYEAHGVHEFVICCGYESHEIKDYFVNYALRQADVTVDLWPRTRSGARRTGSSPGACTWSSPATRP